MMLRTVPPSTPHAVLALACSARGSPHSLWDACWDKEVGHAVCDGRPCTDGIRRNTRPYNRDERAAPGAPCPSEILAHARAWDPHLPDLATACAARAFVPCEPPVRGT